MVTIIEFGESGQDPLPVPNNDNLQLKPDWMTTAEFVQWLRHKREKLRRELEADMTLLSSPTHRLDWEILDAMERCADWHLFGVRERR